jgi:hypothetical protein
MAAGPARSWIEADRNQGCSVPPWFNTCRLTAHLTVALTVALSCWQIVDK